MQEQQRPTLAQKTRANARLAKLPKRKQTAKEFSKLVADEQTRTYVPNRAMLRRARGNGGRRARLLRAIKMARINAPALTEAQQDRQAAKALILADRRERLMLDVPIEPRPPKLNKYGRVEKG